MTTLTPTRTVVHPNGHQAAPRVVFRADDARAQGLSAGDLMQVPLDQWQDHFGQVERVVARIDAWGQWPAGARRVLLSLLAGLAKRAVDCAIEIDGEVYHDVFEATVGALAGSKVALAEQAQRRDGAIEAAAMCYPTAPELTADQINRRLAEQEAPLFDTSQLRRSIRHLAECHQRQELEHEDAGAIDQGREAGHREPGAGLAATLAEAYLEERRECAGLGSGHLVLRRFRGGWYTWESPIWRTTPEETLQAHLKRFIAQCGVALSPGLIDRVKLELEARTWLECEDVDPPFVVHTENPLRVEPAPHLLAVANGLLDLRTVNRHNEPLALGPPDPDYFVTTALPVAYEPEATCPQWEEFLGTAFSRARAEGFDLRRELLAEFFFYTLLEDCRHERMLMLVGPEHQGQRIVLDVLEALLGHQQVSRVPFSQLANGIGLDKLAGKRANLTSVTGPLGKFDETLLKQLICAEPVTVQRKQRTSIDVRSTAKLAVACTELGVPRLNDPAVRDRLIVIPFNTWVWEDELCWDFAARLAAEELPGILNWVLRVGGLLSHNDLFTECGVCVSAGTRQWEQQDPIAQFVEEVCEQQGGSWVFRAALYELFCHYWRTRLKQPGKPPMCEVFGKQLHNQVRRAWRIELEPFRPTMDDGVRPWAYRNLTLSETGYSIMCELEVSRFRDFRI